MQFSSSYSCEHLIAESTCSKVIFFYFVLNLPYFYTDILIKYSQFNFAKLATIMKYMMMNLMIKKVYSAFVTISWYSCIFLAIATITQCTSIWLYPWWLEGFTIAWNSERISFWIILSWNINMMNKALSITILARIVPANLSTV